MRVLRWWHVAVTATVLVLSALLAVQDLAPGRLIGGLAAMAVLAARSSRAAAATRPSPQPCT